MESHNFKEFFMIEGAAAVRLISSESSVFIDRVPCHIHNSKLKALPAQV